MRAADGKLFIQRMQNTFLLPENIRDCPQTRGRLKAAFTDRVAAGIGDVLNELGSDSGELVFIRKLEIECDLDLARTDSELVRFWSGRLLRTLAATLAGAEQRDDCVRFENRAAYLRHYLLDRTTGSADSAWYYAQFDGLRHMPDSIALRTALLEDVPTGIDAMRGLRKADAVRVIGALDERAAWRVLDAFAGDRNDTTGFSAAVLDCVRNACDHGARDFQRAPARQALRWFLQTDASPSNTGQIAACLAAIACLTASNNAAASDELRHLILSGNVERVYRTAGVDVAQRLQPVVSMSRSDRASILAIAADSQSTPAEAVASFTPFGGAFLLLPALVELHIAHRIQGWPAPEEGDGAALMRLLILCSCFGHERSEQAFNDVVLRTITDVSPWVSLDVVRQWLSSLSDHDIQDFGEIAAVDSTTDFLRLRGRFGEHGGPNELVAQSAQWVWARLRARLGRIADASYPWLIDNLLPASASVLDDGDADVVTLSRPPLAVMLSIAGLDRQAYTLPWLDDREIRIEGESL